MVIHLPGLFEEGDKNEKKGIGSRRSGLDGKSKTVPFSSPCLQV